MQNLIEQIKNRDPSAFRQLVAKHQRLLYSIALTYGTKQDADDIVQTTWERAIAKINQLQSSDNFTRWICRICRNTLLDAHRRNVPNVEYLDDEYLSDWNEQEKLYEEYEGIVRFTIQMLPEEQRKIIQLRFFSGLSYSEIALVCSIDVKLVKSRLFEAKKKLKHHLSNLYNGLEIPQKQLYLMEEHAMNEFEKATLGAAVFCRLSLNTQTRFVDCIKNNDVLSSDILEEIGKIREGVKFIEEFHTKLLLPELVNILSACDRYTEVRLVNELEIIAPSSAELIKQNTYVFEDIAILSKKSREILFSRVEHSTLQKAMSIAGSRVKAILLSDLDSKERQKWYMKIGETDSELEDIQAAQMKVVSALREMDSKNEIEIAGLPAD